MRIINASKRTDLPTFYFGWLSDYMLKNSSEFFVLWTKDIRPMLSTGVLDKVPNWYIQHTLTAYHEDIEPNVHDKKDIISSLTKIAKRFGKDRIILRYDPILLTNRYTIDYHIKAFTRYVSIAKDITDSITFSYLDWYKNIPKELIIPNQLQQLELAKAFSSIAKDSNISLSTCAESIDLSSLGIYKSQCVCPKRIEFISGVKLDNHDSAYQRKQCGCIKAEDIGTYNHKCIHKCVYCYANHNK